MGRHGRRKKSKKPRGSRGVRQAPSVYDRHVAHLYHDLFVPLPKPSSGGAEGQIQSQLLLRQVLDRLAFTGYTTAAVAHTVYGRPKPETDSPDVVFPSFSSDENDEDTGRPGKRRRAERGIKAPVPPAPIKVLKRLHAVVENLSDVAAYTLPRTSESPGSSSIGVLERYDLVSISPRNDATFQAACVSATATHVLTLDYTSGRGGVQLPFRIRPVDVKALAERGAAIELPYAPALLQPNQRKALVQTARELQMASIGVQPKPSVILSSGDRTVGDMDSGAMALRSPGDLINVVQTVLRFDQTTSYDLLSASGAALLTRTDKQHIGGHDGDIVVKVSLKTATSIDKAEIPQDDVVEEARSEPANNDKEQTEEKTESQDLEDGFITFV